KPAVGRLQAENPAQRGRHADRPIGIGAERDRHETAGDRAARAAGGAARHPAHVVRIARGAVVHVLAGEVVGVFAHVERAHEHPPGPGAVDWSRGMRVASRLAGARSWLIFEPASVGSPAMSNKFLTANGTPASDPTSRRPFARSASSAAALASARSSVTAVNA